MDDPGQALIRRVLPAVVALLVSLGLARWYLEQAGWIGSAAGVSAMTGAAIALAWLLLFRCAQTIRRITTAQRHFDRNEQYRAVARNLSDGGIFAFDRDLRYTFAESAGLADVGLSVQELEGRLLRDVLEPADAEGLVPVLLSALDGNASTFELPFRGEVFRLDVFPTRDDEGEIVGVLMLTRKITEQRRLEEQLLQAQKLEAIGRLARGVAHDFNNILFLVQVHAELIATGKRTPDDIGAIIEAIERGKGLSNQLLAFGKHQSSAPRALMPNDVVTATAELIEPALGETISLSLDLDEHVGQVIADPSQLEQVIMNLLINARDALPGGGSISIETGNRELDETFAPSEPNLKAGSYVLIAVTDTGVGMDAETRSHIFEPLYTTKAEGTGLGLSTVYGIVQQAGGFIWVYSQPGQGTSFKVYLPRTEPSGQPQSARFGSAERILVVDDIPAVGMLTARVLTECGYQALYAPNEQSAVEAFERAVAPFDLALCDLLVGDSTGPEIVGKLRQRAPGLPVLFTSGHTRDALERLGGGLDERTGFIGKPFSADRLTEQVAALLDAALRPSPAVPPTGFEPVFQP